MCRVPVGLGARRTRTGAAAAIASNLEMKTGLTGLEPATSAVTGRCSNRLNYSPIPGLTRGAGASPTSKVSLADLPTVNGSGGTVPSRDRRRGGAAISHPSRRAMSTPPADARHRCEGLVCGCDPTGSARTCRPGSPAASQGAPFRLARPFKEHSGRRSSGQPRRGSQGWILCRGHAPLSRTAFAPPQANALAQGQPGSAGHRLPCAERPARRSRCSCCDNG